MFKISVGFERLFNFILSFFLVCHIVSCLWVMMANFSDDIEETWMEPYYEMDTVEIYINSIYFTVTTITTVGFGDISGSTKIEKIFCVFIMVIGVVSFSFASGSLSSII